MSENRKLWSVVFSTKALMALAARRQGWRSRVGMVGMACILLGSTSVLVAALFVPVSGPYLLVPVQVLRSFHLIYALGVVLCGGALAGLMRRINRNVRVRPLEDAPVLDPQRHQLVDV